MTAATGCRACDRLAAKPIYTPSELALVLGRSRSWVEAKLASGLLPGVRDGSRWIVRHADLVRAGWLVQPDSQGAADVAGSAPTALGGK